MEDEKIEQMGSIKPSIFWHIRVRNSIRELHPSYRALSEEEVKMVPDEYWYPDPIHLTKP